MKKIILVISLILFTTIAFFVSCSKNERDNKIIDEIKINNNLKSGEDFWEKGFEPGVIYNFYTLIDSTDLAYKTSFKIENEILLIAECKIKAIDVPEGCYTKPSVGFIGIPNNDLIFNGDTLEYTFIENTMCEIPIGFSDLPLKSNLPGYPKIYSGNHTKCYYCYCHNRVYNVNGEGKCEITHISDNNSSCKDCGCKATNSDCRCVLGTCIKNSGDFTEILPFGVLYVKMNNFNVVSKL